MLGVLKLPLGAALLTPDTAGAASGVSGTVAGSANSKVVAAEAGGGIWILSKP